MAVDIVNSIFDCRTWVSAFIALATSRSLAANNFTVIQFSSSSGWHFERRAIVHCACSPSASSRAGVYLLAGTISGREEGLACAASRRDDRHVAGVGRPPPTVALVFYQTLSSHAVVARLLASAHELSTASFHASVYRYVCLGKPVFECVYSASKLLM